MSESSEGRRVAAQDVNAFFQAMPREDQTRPSSAEGRKRLELDPENTTKGLAQLVLTVIKLLHELMERQAIRRMDSGSLSEDQIERLGQALMRQSEELDRLRQEFDLEDEDLNLDLGPLGRLL